MRKGFAVWLTGLPASGKSTIARALKRNLIEKHSISTVHLESDELRKILTPNPTYRPEERDWFYSVLVFLARLLTENGLNVILDATASKRTYRNNARTQISRFIEVYVQCPLETCMQRDPKGIYRMAREKRASSVPGMDEEYEEPREPDVVVDSLNTGPEEAAEQIIGKLQEVALSRKG